LPCGLKLAIAFFQAYVFVILTSYIKDGLYYIFTQPFVVVFMLIFVDNIKTLKIINFIIENLKHIIFDVKY
jgi:hypothetical protein